MATQAQLDPCSRKHGGNKQSELAFERVNVLGDSLKVLSLIALAGENGLTSAELEVAMEKSKHKFSGRITTLKILGLILETGSRSGCAVLIATDAGKQQAVTAEVK